MIFISYSNFETLCIKSKEFLNDFILIENDSKIKRYYKNKVIIFSYYWVQRFVLSLFILQAPCQVELENWVNSIHSACAAAFARHRGKTGTLHLLQVSSCRHEKGRADFDIFFGGGETGP